MKNEKERAPQLRPAVYTMCPRFEKRDFLDYLNDCMSLPLLEEFEKHIEACDECAARLHRYQVRFALWDGKSPCNAEDGGEEVK